MLPATGETPENGKENGKEKGREKGQKKRGVKPDGQKPGLVWVPYGELVKPLKVNVGITNGSTTEVSGDEVKEDMEVVVGQRVAEKGKPATTNPFTPQIGNRRR